MIKVWNVFSDIVAFRSIFWTLRRVVKRRCLSNVSEGNVFTSACYSVHGGCTPPIPSPLYHATLLHCTPLYATPPCIPHTSSTTPPPHSHRTRMATDAVGMHPTGMLSYDLMHFVFSILAILESGMLQKWQRDHWHERENKCDKSLSTVGHSAAGVLSTAGAYIALAVGIAIAVTVLLLEMLVKYIQKVHWIKFKLFEIRHTSWNTQHREWRTRTSALFQEIRNSNWILQWWPMGKIILSINK